MPYLVDGTEVTVLAKTDMGFVVLHVYDDEDEVIYFDEKPFLVNNVFDTPPTLRCEQRIKSLQDDIAVLEHRKREIEKSIAAVDSQNKARIAKLQQYEQLRLLEDFIDGKITHYVEMQYGVPRIVKFDDAKTGEDYRDELKLLSLFGDSKGNLLWKINCYRDGSGGYTLVAPVTSEEEALKVAKQYIVDSMTDLPVYFMDRVVEAAKEFGVEIPVEYAAKYREKVTEEANKNIAEAERLISVNKAKLDALE